MSRRSGHRLECWEIALIKAMLANKEVPQDILAYFSRPTRSINHARISEIRDGHKHTQVKTATDYELKIFQEEWPDLDPSTGLSLRGDELLIKSREAMIAAVHTFNSAGIYFRAELFIVSSIISWTYLMRAFFKSNGIDYRYKKDGAVVKTVNGADKYWELGKCLKHQRCPLEQGVKNNLEFLLVIRHEIEHRSTNRIDDALSAKLQACCLNFNDAIKALFGVKFGLEKKLPIALQFVTFDGAQRASLVGANLPPNISTAMNDFHERLSEEEQADPRFRFRVAFVPKSAGKATNSDLAIEFVKAGSMEVNDVERVLFKETEKKKYRATKIVEKVQMEGFNSFKMFDHIKIFQQLSAKDPNKGYGVDVDGHWFWYDTWFDKIIEKLQEGWKAPRKRNI